MRSELILQSVSLEVESEPNIELKLLSCSFSTSNSGRGHFKTVKPEVTLSSFKLGDKEVKLDIYVGIKTELIM